jgi:hypothetical protein
MRPDPASAELSVLQLLARADELALAAGAAIRAGNDSILFDALDQRSATIEAAIQCWRAVPLSARSAQLQARVNVAAQSAFHAGLVTRDLAIQARDDAVAELSALEARQFASSEYEQRADAARGSINVVL